LLFLWKVVDTLIILSSVATTDCRELPLFLWSVDATTVLYKAVLSGELLLLFCGELLLLLGELLLLLGELLLLCFLWRAATTPVNSCCYSRGELLSLWRAAAIPV
jgi:hypothetical protein